MAVVTPSQALSYSALFSVVQPHASLKNQEIFVLLSSLLYLQHLNQCWNITGTEWVFVALVHERVPCIRKFQKQLKVNHILFIDNNEYGLNTKKYSKL